MVLDDWISLSLPSNDNIKIRKDRVVTSISELSGIRGTQMLLSLRVMTSSIMMIVCVAIQQDLQHRGSTLLRLDGREDMVPLFMLIEIIGFFMTGESSRSQRDVSFDSSRRRGLTASIADGHLFPAQVILS